jgi:hypothetical protein
MRLRLRWPWQRSSGSSGSINIASTGSTDGRTMLAKKLGIDVFIGVSHGRCAVEAVVGDSGVRRMVEARLLVAVGT